MSSPIATLQAELENASKNARCFGICQEAENTFDIPGFHLFAKTRSGWLRTAANVYLCPLSFPEGGGALVALSEGNYKDEGSAIAAAIIIAELHKQFACPNEGADAGQLLEEATIAAHKRIFATAQTTTVLGADWSFNTVMGSRSNLEGIGACVVAAVLQPSGEGSLVHVGDCRASTISAQGIRNLSTDHTLANEIAQGRVETNHPGAEHVVTRVLGFGEVPPEVDKVQFTLEPNERLLLSSSLARFAASPDLAARIQDDTDPREIAERSFGRWAT